MSMSDDPGSISDDPGRGHAIIDSFAFNLDPDMRIDDPVIAMALAEWNRLRDGRPMPSPADVDALDLPKRLLPHLLLLDVDHQPALRFRWRLIGTHTTLALGRDSTGRYWDELYDERGFATLSRGPLWVLRHGRPVRVLGNASYADKDHLRSENVNLPLSLDGTTVNRIMIATVYSVR